MDFKIGDKVKFLNDVGGGVVTRIIDKTLVGVLVDDGFEVPVMASELIKTESAPEEDISNLTQTPNNTGSTITMVDTSEISIGDTLSITINKVVVTKVVSSTVIEVHN